jgi:hypothetical protein
MRGPGRLVVVAAVLVFLTPAPARAGELDLTAMRGELSPVARRLAGSGISGRSLAAAGTRHRLTLATLSIHLGERAALRAGVGAAIRAAEPFLDAPREAGIALAGGLRVTMLRTTRLAIDVSLSAARAEYEGHALTDATALVLLQVR